MNGDAVWGIYTLSVEVSDEAIIPQRATALATVAIEDTLFLADAPPLTARAGALVSLHTFTASGGTPPGTAWVKLTRLLLGNADYFSIGDSSGVLQMNGGAVEGIYTLSVEVWDDDVIFVPERATAMATVKVVKVLTLQTKVSDKSIDLHAFAPDASAYSIVAGNDDGYFAIGETSGVLSVQAWTPVGNYPLDIGIISSDSPPRVVVSAVVVEITDYPTPAQRKIYVLGGYSTNENGSNVRNDVWSSVNGANWSLETSSAAWSEREKHQALSHNGRLYVLGGYDGNNRLNDVWSSTDGQNWLQVTGNAGWHRREEHQALSHNGRLYVLGGRYYVASVVIKTNDVWSSADGKNWRQEKADNNVGWPARDSYQALSHNGRMYVLGGDGNNPYNDVWSSEDGRVWVKVTVAADWSARQEYQAVSHNDSLYVLGGVDYDDNEKNDVWSSADGKNWRQEKADNNMGWQARNYHQALSLNGFLYVLGGHDSDGDVINLYNDVWSSADGSIWILKTGSADWSARAAHQAVVFPPNVPETVSTR